VKFTRAKRRKLPRYATSDKRGQVQVRVVRAYASNPVKGNITRTVTIKDAKVSEVFAAIERGLFK
jgi:hypothetical protein